MLFKVGVHPERSAVVCAIVVVAGCSPAPSAEPHAVDAGDASSESGGDANVEPDGASEVGTDAADATPDSGPPHPCLSAPMLELDELAEGTINAVVGEARHYRFVAEAGQSLLLSAASTAVTPITNDLALTLMSADGTAVLAAWDDASTYHPGDPLLITRISEGGTYCARIEHASSWSHTPPLPVSGSLGYQFSVSALSGQKGVFDDTEPNDDLGSAQTLVGVSADGFLISGTLEGANDVDVYRIAAAVGTRFSLTLWTGGSGGPGVNGDGSTLMVGEVQLSDGDGNVLGRLEPGMGRRRMLTPIPDGAELLLSVRRAPGSVPGDNDFYNLLGITESALSQEEDETAAGENDSPATAEPMPPTPDPYFPNVPPVYQLFWAAGQVNDTPTGSPIDIDHWSFSATENDKLELFCYSRRMGSGVVNPRFSVLAPSGEVLREAVESTEHALIWGYHYEAVEPPLVLPETGEYFLRVTADGQAPDVASRYYWCILIGWPG